MMQFRSQDLDDPLLTPVQFVPGVGPARAELLARLDLHTVRDLLLYLPRDVLDLTQVRAVHELTTDAVQSIRGEVVDLDARYTSSGKHMTAVLLKCDGGFVRSVWFNQPYMLHKFQHGDRVLLSGKPRFRDKRWEFSHPHVQWLQVDDEETTGGVLPRYGLTEGLKMHELRRIMCAAVENFAQSLPEHLPSTLRERCRLLPLPQAIRQIHAPKTVAEYQAGFRRVVFEDLLEFQLALAVRRNSWLTGGKAVPLPVTAKIDARIRRLFPFKFTAGQDHAVRDISADLAKDHPMHRLLQADVGAGKTAVAVYAMLTAIANGSQAVLMAPTEILASQHWETIESLLSQSRVERCLLTGQLSAAARRHAVDRIAKGEIQLVVGTQAVIQDAVTFANLGIAVIDEQHRFGVRQRAKFSLGDRLPHVLVMTATPIPRSLCLTQFGDLDLSVITEMPPGRQRVVTSRVYGDGAKKVWDFIRQKLREGRQLYVVCPRIGTDEDESTDVTECSVPGTQDLGSGASSAEVIFQRLQRTALRDFRIGLLHGRMDSDRRSDVMAAFRDGELQALVTTTVIEVGIDVPNATLMVVFDAERFGLSQLHQLRGRVSRGKFQGYCFLFSEGVQAEGLKRLAALEETSDGFRIAEADFELRGPGDVLGVRQHGLLPLRSADLHRDKDVLEEARTVAFDLVASGEWSQPDYAPLRRAVLDRFGRAYDLPQSG
jgi:ATP-dependent DNA helicase RecG